MKNIVIKKLEKKHIKDYIRLQQEAYPAVYQGNEEEIDRMVPVIEYLMTKEDLTYYGAFCSGNLAGAMIHVVFKMNFHGVLVRVDGIGSVAVSLLDKKKSVAKELIFYILNHSKLEGAKLFTLYPFNPAFYKNFGFGYGAPLYHYQIPPSHFSDKGNRSLLTVDVTQEEILKFYNDNSREVNGTKHKSSLDIRVLNRSKILAAKMDNKVIGYLLYKQEKLQNGNFLDQRMTVEELVYNSPLALQAFFSFFRSQADQINYIDFYSFDSHLHHALGDLVYYSDHQIMPFVAHKTAEVGVGIMWQALNPEYLLTHIFKDQALNCRFDIISASGDVQSVSIGFASEDQIDIQMDIQSFSSWSIGAVKLAQLYDYGKIKTAHPESLGAIDLVLNLKSPICHAHF